MSARSNKEKKGFTTVLLRFASPPPPKEATPPGEGINAPVILLIDRIREDRARASQQGSPAIG